MPAWHGTLTLSGSAQLLSSITGAPGDLMKQVDVSAAEDNTGIVYGGGAAKEWMTPVNDFTLSDSNYGWRVEIPVTPEGGGDPVPYPPVRVVESSIGIAGLGDIQVIGTENDVIHVFAVW